MTLEAVLKEAMTLTPCERALLTEALWRSIPHAEADFALTTVQHADLKQRLREDDAGQSDPQDWQRAKLM